MATPTYRDATGAGGTGTTITVTEPAGAQPGDRLLCVLQHNNGVSITRPSDWTPLTPVFGSGILRAYIFEGTVDGSGGPWAFTLNASSPWAVVCIALAPDGGFDAEVDVMAGLVEASTSTGPAITPTITPYTDDCLLMHVAAWPRATTFSPPGGGTERAEARAGNGSADHSVWVGTQTGGSAGAPNTPVSITNDNPFSWGAGRHNTATIALRAAPPPTTWTGDFETGDFSQWRSVHRAADDRAEIRTDGPYAGTYYCRAYADDADVYPLTATENPRIQLNSPSIIGDGDERWCSIALRLPVGWPTVPIWPDGWLVLAQCYGLPYNQSPPIAIEARGDEFTLTATGTTNILWRAPIVRGEWVTFAIRARFRVDNTGWVELWYNGEPQKLRDSSGRRRHYMRTRLTGSTADMLLEWRPCVYRKVGSIPGTIYCDFDSARIGATPPSWLTKAYQTPTVPRPRAVA